MESACLKTTRIRLPLWALMLAVPGLALSAAACSSGTSSSGSPATGSSAPAAVSGAPEKPDITVGVLPSADSVTVQIAQDQGLFQQQGLNVKVVTEKTTNDGTSGLLSHTMDFTSENYAGMFTQENTVPGLNLRIVADNSQASPGGYILLVAKNSKLTSVSQLKGKRVSFPAPGVNFGYIALTEQLAPYHLSVKKDITSVVLPFSAAQQALASGLVDAAFTTEPFTTAAEAAAGDRVLIDLMSGPLAGEPQACWGITASFARQYPKTVAAFQRAMARATQAAAASPSYVREELPRFIPTMKPAIAKVIVLPTYNTTLTLARMERVATDMERLGGLPKNFDVKAMYDPLEGPAS